jgi:hypothetical protein
MAERDQDGAIDREIEEDPEQRVVREEFAQAKYFIARGNGPAARSGQEALIRDFAILAGG